MQYLLAGMFGRACRALGNPAALGEVAGEVGALRGALQDKLAGVCATAGEGFPAVLGNLWLGEDEAQVGVEVGGVGAKRGACCLSVSVAAASSTSCVPPAIAECLLPPCPLAPGPPALRQAVASALLPKLEKTRREVEEVLFEVVTLEVGGMHAGGREGV